MKELNTTGRDERIVRDAVGVEHGEPVGPAEVHLSCAGIHGVRPLIELISRQPVVEIEVAECLRRGSNFESPLLVLSQRFPRPSSSIPRMTSSGSPSFTWYEVNVLVRAVHAVQSAGRPYPQVTCAIFIEARDEVVAQTVRIRVIMPEVCEYPRLPVHPVQTSAKRSHPEVACPVFEKGEHPTAPETAGDGIDMMVVCECSCGAVKPVKPGVDCSGPDGPLTILIECIHLVATKAPGSAGLRL